MSTTVEATRDLRAPSAPAGSRRRLALPSLADLVFGTILFIVPVAFSSRIFAADGDLARHIRVGSLFLERGGLIHEDIFSYTMPGAPMVPYLWLSEVAYALAYRMAGPPGTLLLAAAVIALSYALVVWFLRRRGVDPLLAVAIALVAASMGAVHWLARPHLFSFVGAILTLELVERERPRDLLWFVPLFALWANLHGGFLFGLIIIGIYAVGDLAEILAGGDRRRWTGRLRYHAAAFAVALVATLVTPVGPRILLHTTGYLMNPYLVAVIQEYHSPDFHDLVFRVYLALILLLIAVLAHVGRRPSYPRLLLLLVTLGFALHSVRNFPLFGLTAWPALALGWDAEWRRIVPQRLAHIRAVLDTGDRRAAGGAWSLAAIALAALYLGGRPESVTLDFDPRHYPVAAVEWAREAGVGGRIFNEFIWGGYMLLAWPEQKVFIDGQVDVYGEGLVRAFRRIDGLEPGWRKELERWEVDTVLVRGESHLAYALAHEPGWAMAYCDETAALFTLAGSTVSTTEFRAGCPAELTAGR